MEELISRQSPEAQAIIRLLLSQLTELKAEVAELKAEIVRLKKTPRNSSLPPSSQHPHAKPAAKKPKSKRKRGGQPGQAKCERPLLPCDACDDVKRIKPCACRRCGTKLVGSDPDPLRLAATGITADIGLLPVAGALLASQLAGVSMEVLLSFTCAALLYLVTEELLVEAHEIQEGLESALTTAMFFVGVLALLIVDMDIK